MASLKVESPETERKEATSAAKVQLASSGRFVTQQAIFLGWMMCLGKHTEFRVFEASLGQRVSRTRRHPFDRFYNFFSRSAWTVQSLAHQVCVLVVLRLCPEGILYLVVDDTLLHKRGLKVYGLGWFRDAVASTAKRVFPAPGAPVTVTSRSPAAKWSCSQR